MEKTILIAGISGELQTELVQEALSQRYRTAVALDPGTERPPIGEDWENLLKYFEWNKRSSLSARNLILEVQSFAEILDEAFFIFEPPPDGRPLHEVPIIEIESTVDEWTKGFLFLTKELLTLFQKKKRGLLTLVLHEHSLSVSPLSTGVVSCFRAMGSALFAQYQNESFTLRGFQSATRDVKDFVHFLVTTWEKPEKTFGKWTKYSSKGSLWSFGRS
ncbi:MAG TPA: hypothetical protein PLG79_05385 [Spirochaetales bacterium]|nr:hypothetical protein [Spirochaetales bacterium]HOV38135.1 hypothetical protein [Spirochaetales bacterium]